MERVPRRIDGKSILTNVPRTLLGSVFGTIEGERNVSEKQNEMKKLLEKMRTNTDKLNRKTEAPPVKRNRRRMQKVRQGEARRSRSDYQVLQVAFGLRSPCYDVQTSRWESLRCRFNRVRSAPTGKNQGLMGAIWANHGLSPRPRT